MRNILDNELTDHRYIGASWEEGRKRFIITLSYTDPDGKVRKGTLLLTGDPDARQEYHLVCIIKDFVLHKAGSTRRRLRQYYTWPELTAEEFLQLLARSEMRSKFEMAVNGYQKSFLRIIGKIAHKKPKDISLLDYLVEEPYPDPEEDAAEKAAAVAKAAKIAAIRKPTPARPARGLVPQKAKPVAAAAAPAAAAPAPAPAMVMTSAPAPQEPSLPVMADIESFPTEVIIREIKRRGALAVNF